MRLGLGRAISQAAPIVPETRICNYPWVNGVRVNKTSGCDEARNSNTIAASGIASVKCTI
jgi:hypothetical protein